MSYSDETMQDNVDALLAEIVGHKIVSVEKAVKLPDKRWYNTYGTAITLDNGKKVFLIDSADCCAYTELDSFLLNADKIDHVITNVNTSDNYDTWHVLANMEEVLKLDVSWSEGTGYYSYGFSFQVFEPEEWEQKWLEINQEA